MKCPDSDTGTEFDVQHYSIWKNRRCVMKPMPDADEYRRLGKAEAEIAEKLPAGAAKQVHLQKAWDHESSAHSQDWRDSILRAPKQLNGFRERR
jgi:hypothetical protein